MSGHETDRTQPISLWRVQASLGGNGWSDAAYGFGGPDVAEAIGSADEVGAELTRFFDSLALQEVEAERIRTGRFFVRLEVEPYEHSAATLLVRRSEHAAEDRVLRWEAHASAGNADGVFDACYSHGNGHDDAGHLLGTADRLGAELARVMKELSHGDVAAIRYGTTRFYLALAVRLPQEQQS